MSTFTVNPDSLDALAAHLENLGHRMLSLQRLPSGDATSLGGSHVQLSLEHFSDDWAYGVSLLNRSIAALAISLKQAATAYHSTDTEVSGRVSADERALAPLFAADTKVDREIAAAVAASQAHAHSGGSHTAAKPTKPTSSSGSGTETIGGGPASGSRSGSGTETIGGGSTSGHSSGAGLVINDPSGAPITIHDPTGTPVTVNAPAGTKVHITAPSGTTETVQGHDSGYGTQSAG